ncbi:TPA: hypothetical protein ACHBVP_000764 [Klebsiella pneumoniae]
MAQITDERLVKILSETQATIMEHNSRCVRGSVEVDARLFESMIMELQVRRKAAMNGEPFAYIIQDKYERERGIEGHLSRSHVSKYVSQEDINEHEITCTPLYRHAQPELEHYSMFDVVASILDGIDRTELEDGWWETSTGAESGREALEKIRAAMLAAAPQEVK